MTLDHPILLADFHTLQRVKHFPKITIQREKLGAVTVKKGNTLIILEEVESQRMGLDVVEVQYSLDGETHLHDMERCDFSDPGQPPLWSSRFTLKVTDINADLIECQVYRCNFADLIECPDMLGPMPEGDQLPPATLN